MKLDEAGKCVYCSDPTKKCGFTGECPHNDCGRCGYESQSSAVLDVHESKKDTEVRALPSTVRLCGVDIDIRTSDPGDWSPGAIGRANEMDGCITLKAGLPTSTMHAVLLHEVVHLSLDLHGYRDESGNEKIVAALATALHGFIRDNSSVVMWIAGEPS